MIEAGLRGKGIGGDCCVVVGDVAVLVSLLELLARLIRIDASIGWR